MMVRMHIQKGVVCLQIGAAYSSSWIGPMRGGRTGETETALFVQYSTLIAHHDYDHDDIYADRRTVRVAIFVR
jgi:hypothetical protein